MSAMMRVYRNTRLKKIFISYDFKQVRDAIMLLFSSDKTNRFEKIFIYANSNGWETDVLRYYVDEEKYRLMCKKLQYLFDNREEPADFEAIDVEKAVENYANVLDGPEE